MGALLFVCGGTQGWRNDFESGWARSERADEWGGGLRHNFFLDFKFFRHLYLIHVGVVLLHARPLW